MVLFVFLLTLIIRLSCQDVPEKNLNQVLDQLIEETAVAFSNENENNSRIIYIKPENVTRRSSSGLKFASVKSTEYEDLENLVQHIEDSKANALQNGGEITVQIERTSGHFQVNTDKEDMEIINAISKSDSPFEEGVNNVVMLSSDPENDLIHKYPELIIDKITSDVTKNENKVTIKEPSTMRQTTQYLTDEDKKELAAKTLDSLVKIIMKGASTRNFDAPKEPEPDDVENVGRSAHIHNDYHNHVINNLPFPYSSILPRGKTTLGKLPEGYRDLHHIINRPMSSYLDSNLQLTRWGGNAGQNPLMSIPRAYNRNRVQFIPKPLARIVPRIIYQPVFSRQFLG